MDKKLVFGAIGLMFGNAHLEGALAYGAEVAAICDLDPETLRNQAKSITFLRKSGQLITTTFSTTPKSPWFQLQFPTSFTDRLLASSL
ncbi:MAG: hypothetical protein IKV44_00890 [Clostridia bacterium]|nr:hypothetical protein [Clostridia bacterium]